MQKKFSENTVVFLSIIWWKFQEFKLHAFREIEFFLGGCFLCRTLYIVTCTPNNFLGLFIIDAQLLTQSYSFGTKGLWLKGQPLF